MKPLLLIFLITGCHTVKVNVMSPDYGIFKHSPARIEAHIKEAPYVPGLDLFYRLKKLPKEI